MKCHVLTSLAVTSAVACTDATHEPTATRYAAPPRPAPARISFASLAAGGALEVDFTSRDQRGESRDYLTFERACDVDVAAYAHMLRWGIADTVTLLFDPEVVSDARLRGLDALLTHYRSGRGARCEVRESFEPRAVRSGALVVERYEGGMRAPTRRVRS